ncbi:S8 family serine peptidase [Chungangia koreensis]|uniref:S8 family serine peptidase n=1 Tax=Chungangia koreensis TaxID=752657 RepID=A0ABV8X5A7_9LACT
MKNRTLIILLCLTLLLPFTSPAMAEEAEDVLLMVPEGQELLFKDLPVTNVFDFIPFAEAKLTDSEQALIRKMYPTIKILKDKKYEIMAESIPPAFNTIKATQLQTTPYTGKGVKVGVLDTGIATNHSDLNVRGGYCSLPSACPTESAFNDNNGHGTHVAGTIAALNNNSGIVGVAPNAELYAIKALGENGEGDTRSIVKGVEWAIQNDMDILNLSITTKTDDPALRMVLNKAYENGILIIASAGNEGKLISGDSVLYPAKYDSVIAVSALSSQTQKLAESSQGPAVEVTAPGYNITSTFPRSLDILDGNQNGYTALSGTSMAAPHVTGILALYKERFPDASQQRLRQLLQLTAQDIGVLGRDEVFGYGIATYESVITNVPTLEVNSGDGRIHMSVQNVDAVKEWSLTENGTTITETAPGEWETYRPAGIYRFEFSFEMDNGQVFKNPITVVLSNPTFKDLTIDQWFSSNISYLYYKKQMNGTDDGKIEPFREITRAEAVALLGRAKGLNGEERVTRFKDVGTGNFASGYIQSAYEAGILSGFPDGTFRPSQSVTRAEMAILIQNAFGFPTNAGATMPFTDVNQNMASYDEILALYQSGIAKGYSATTFEPNMKMNRASFSAFLSRAQRPDLFK